ncbi:MAG: undecaprenyl-diphosphatase [Candidatus Dactylopiibacterium carminicum]|uniref:Undecaprenyl-diphosphatase n=1 Tax=Candidatus Dactylopiibacterium carminicum TaxID=857335 RepID=A0A272ENM9_9RHOO|nr:undecaprenyl-diphosphate phosphatase [Candidatus Dactylopiibacterium carminicum]KAF7597658.1 undecaprenyl-diphosphate phosphatase [Candidatus Dactylopiibacterium carminicum]PAS91280.1 MAG: undecaprenyl-diphosphatase [Candidatus Dactylopiibacterium carminicum]PAS93413.1 MAG: undecaprenyl-diphosphatase [Candidatus Dactylopiibacterium carminicum]
MDLLLLLKAAVLGVVEGLTEFLPISSTGHLILAGSLLDFSDERAQLFMIVIQAAAILAVVWEFRARLGCAVKGLPHDPQARALFINVGIAFVPLAALGLMFGGWLKAHLFNAPVVATSFILGAFVILWAERKDQCERVARIEDMNWLDALKVGIAQCFSLIPGTSRSGATIIGGMLFGLSRKAATEFTFFLAIPTLGIASLYSLYKERELLSFDDLGMWAVGMTASFLSAFLVVRWLIRFVSQHSFRIFAWYRIAFGVIVLMTWQLDLVHWVEQ